MKCIEVAKTFDAIERVSGRLEITRLLAELFKRATPHEAEIIAFLSLGQLHPQYVGTQFNLAEKNLIKVIATFLSLSEQYVQSLVKKVGDVGAVLNQYTWSIDKELTLLEVYNQLLSIEAISGTGSQEEKNKKLESLFASLDPLSAQYVARIVVGKLRLGFSDMTIIDALSWMATGTKELRTTIEDAYDICANIGFITRTLKEGGIHALETMHIQVGTPILPAAAERLPTAKAIIEKIGPCLAEPKLDGFRLQIHVNKHRDKTDIHFFSRNLQDMSHMFPDLVKEFSKLDVKELICEGEAIAYDPNTDSFLPFQETVKRKRKHDIEQAVAEFPLRVFVFDVLYLDGKEYLSTPYTKRHKALKEIFKGLKSDTIVVIQHKKIETSKELEEYFYETVATGLEGLMIKRPDAPYKPGKRNFNWIKLKRQEEGHLEDTLDCVILGYYAGEGKRASFGIGAFLVGVYNKEKDNFQTVAKIGTGLKDAEWKELKKRCDEIAIERKSHSVECAKELVPDVWVSPEIVCMIRADEITMSPLHTAGKTEKHLGYALRFPRFMGYRTDKGVYEATTAHEVKRLYEDQYKK